jgi:uncharacterized membrane protein YphA (DoxX/SURF4 family)
MYLGSRAANFAVLIARVWIGIMILAHGWRHVKAIRSGPGMANWFESLGLKPGPLHAWNVTITELVFPFLLFAGFLTPIAYGGVCALMLVAFMTNHRKNGFFLTSAGHARSGEVVARSRLRPLDPVRTEEGTRGHRAGGNRRRRTLSPRVLASAESRESPRLSRRTD